MNFEIDDVIEFKSGKYLVLDVVKSETNTYLYLINNDEFQNDISITKVTNNNGNIEFSNIDNDEEFDYVVNRLFVNASNDVLEFAIEE